METIDVVVVGGGVTGLAAAAAIARAGHDVCVLERHPRPGMDTSTRNSGVVHAGLYYPAGSLKAKLCVEGARDLYAFCERHRVPHARCGKLVVALDEGEVSGLEALKARGEANGAEGLEVIGAGAMRRREPDAAGVAALLSPNTGVVEPERLVHTLARALEEAGGYLLPGTALAGADMTDAGMLLRTERESILAKVVVNAVRGPRVGGARGRVVRDPSMPGRVCRTRAVAHAPGERARLSPPEPVGARPRGASHQDDPGHGPRRADRPSPGQPPRLRVRQDGPRRLP